MEIDRTQSSEATGSGAGKASARAVPGVWPEGCALAGGRYQVERLLGEGGQKQVYLAQDTQLDRRVVIAFLKTSQIDPDGVARIRQEGRALARLGDHPHIVTVYDIGEERSRHYIVMQFLEGGSLDTLRLGMENRRLPIGRALRIGAEISQALRHAHQHGILHRDLKPGNVWLTHEGVTKLGDFGLASRLQLSEITADNVLVGTVSYIAPEILMGGPPRPQSDLYSLGVLLYEITAGRLPFVGDSVAAIISQHLQDSPVAPSWHNAEIPAALDKLILDLLAKAPADRPESSENVHRRLEAILSTSDSVRMRRGATSLDRLATGIFVGRGHEIQQLRAGLEDAFAARGKLLLVVGEAGSGKTATVEQLLTYARMRKAEVLRASCYEGDGAPAYWPWVQLIRAYVRGRTPIQLLPLMGAGAAVLAQLDTEVRDCLPELPPAPPLEPAQARFRLFDSVTSFFKNVGVSQPLVVFIDDLHWADKASLLLLQFLARELHNARLMVVGTYRDVSLATGHPLMEALGDLSGRGLGQRIELRGLEERDVARFIEMTAAIDPPERLVASVFHNTEGNPFFVKEVVRLLVSDGQLKGGEQTGPWNIKLPQGVREVLRRRLSQVSNACGDVLAIASVVGRSFSLDVLERVGDPKGDQLLDALDEGLAARLITEQDAGWYVFSHALVREALYETLTATVRGRLHRRIGEALEELYAGQVDTRLAELAHHFSKAVPLGHGDKAIDYATRAGERADRLLAYEEASAQYEVALRALQLKKPLDRERQVALLMALGGAQTKAGLSDLARDTYFGAAQVARECSWPDRFARAALGIGAATGAGTKLGRTVDEVHIRLLREALDGLGVSNLALTTQLLSQLALALYHTPAERNAVSSRAVEMSRQAKDTPALLAALYSRSVALEGLGSAEERLVVVNELADLADRSGDVELALRAHFRRFRELFELSDIAAVERELQVLFRLAEELRQPRYLWYVPYIQGSLAAFRGQFEEAEDLLAKGLAIGGRAQDPNARLFYAVAHYTVIWGKGQFDESLSFLKQLVERYPLLPGWRAQIPRVYLFLGRFEEGRQEFEALSRNKFEVLGADGSYLSSLAALSVASFLLDDAGRAQQLYELLRPYAGRNIVTGNAALGGGAVSHPLGLAAAAMREWDIAETLLQQGIEKNANMGGRMWLAMARHDYGRVLMARRRPGDLERARREFVQSRALATEIGMTAVADWSANELTRLATG
jgi:tetratricopeptide (TPR) repeat protein